MRLMEGVGLLIALEEGLHYPLSSSAASVFIFFLVFSVCTLSLGLIYSGYLAMGSPCPLTAGLN